MNEVKGKTMQQVMSVSDLNRYIKDLIGSDRLLSSVWVSGEISNYKNHYSGHMYFTIKDGTSVIKCVMFRGNNANLKFKPDNGLKVLIRGSVSVFERDGQYQLYAEEMQPDGLGSLHLAFEQLKAKLNKEGLFDPKHKKPIPGMPRSIGVVTSSTGAVIRDIINVLSRRFYNFDLKLLPVAVQGPAAPGQIAAAVRRFNELANVEVIIVARGGGSLEELWAFNDEMVARSIYASEIPVISAVGHETDFTISDFVADLRAPTPSAAAEIAMPSKDALLDKLDRMDNRLKVALKRNWKQNRLRLEKVQSNRVFIRPLDKINGERLILDTSTKYLINAITMQQERLQARFNMTVASLDALSPLKIMDRGYSMTRFRDKESPIRSVKDVAVGDKISVILKDGDIHCTVDSKNHIEKDDEYVRA